MQSKAEASAGQKSEVAQSTSESELELRPGGRNASGCAQPFGIRAFARPPKHSSAPLWPEAGDARSKELFWSLSIFQGYLLLSFGRVEGEEETDVLRRKKKIDYLEQQLSVVNWSAIKSNYLSVQLGKPKNKFSRFPSSSCVHLKKTKKQKQQEQQNNNNKNKFLTSSLDNVSLM